MPEIVIYSTFSFGTMNSHMIQQITIVTNF